MSNDSRHQRWLEKQAREAARQEAEKSARQAQASKPKSPDDTIVRAWVVPLGVPGTVLTVGLAMIPFQFWLAIDIAFLGAFIFFVDWWFFARKESLRLRLLVSVIPLAAMILIGWLAFRPAPLEITAISLEGNYPDGSMVADIKWDASYSEVRLVLHNGSSGQYQNIDAAVRANIQIVRIGSLNHFTDCKGMAQHPGFEMMGSTLTKNGMNGDPDIDIPLGDWSGDQFRIYCDKILPHDTVEIVVAMKDIRSGKKVKPSWISIRADYDAYFRPNTKPASQCLTGTCKNIPMPD